MSHSHVHETLPRGMLLALGALVLMTVVLAAAARWTGLGTAQRADAQTVASLELRFEDLADGGIGVLDARAGRTIATVAPGTNGFLRSAVRGLVRERKRQGVGAQTPFLLLARADGRLTLEDPTTGRRIDLESFGATNAAVFARLLQP
jgi:putative photosynthetic complex assembly protein